MTTFNSEWLAKRQAKQQQNTQANRAAVKGKLGGLMSVDEFNGTGFGKEDKLQEACVAWFRIQYPNLVLFASLNGVKLRGGGREWKRLEAAGAMAGVADLLLSVPSGELAGLYIEMKTKRGKQSDTQKAFEAKVVAQGYGYAMPRSLGEFMRVVQTYLDSGTY